MIPKPEALVLLYLTDVRANSTVPDVAAAEPPEIMWEIVEQWENANESIDDEDHDAWMTVAGVAALTAIALCQAEIRAAAR